MKMKLNYRHPRKRTVLLLTAAMLAGCAAEEAENSPADPTTTEAAADAAHPDKQDAIDYNIGKLPDRSYVKTYGDAENPRPWYTAAEALGEIGKPAIPALIARLDTQDTYELKLALYALMLASQDPALQAETGGDYLQLSTVLTEESNAENLRLALEWWERHRRLWR